MNTNTFAALPQNLAANFSSTETAVAAVAGGTTRAVLSPRADISGGIFDGHPFKIRVVASGVASGAGNFTVNLYANLGGNTNLTTFTNDVLVLGSGAQALASKRGTVFMEAICMWDSVLQQLSAYNAGGAGMGSLVTTPGIIGSSAAKSNTSGVVGTSLASFQSLGFFVTTSISANGTAASLLELAIDQI